jgi:hypothetical protein
MKLALLFCLAATGFSQGINTKIIDPGTATKIVLNASVATILQFPAQFSAVYGLGIVGKDSKEGGDVQVEYGANRPVLVLHPLKSHVRNCMTVFMSDRMYVFNLEDGDNPDLAVTLESGAVSDPSSKITPQTIVDSRPKYSPDMLVSLMDRAQGAALLKVSDPDDYAGYQHRECDYASDDGYLKTVVKDLHKFPKDDTIVLMGQITNESDTPINFDADHAAIAVQTVKHPVTLLSCRRPIPAKGTVAFVAVLVGDVDGSRANLAIENSLRLVVDTGHYKEHTAEAPAPAPTPIATPAPSRVGPLTEAKKP